MAKQTLIIDCHHLCYRGMFTIGGLSYEEQNTGVIFSFLNQLQQLAVRFDYPKFLFAWDSKRSYRRDVYPDYKCKKQPDPKMEELLSICRPQFSIIRSTVLPIMGFHNNFIQTGLEADDIIAKIVLQYKKRDFIVVSSDNDLYQLLNSRMKMYDIKNKQFYTHEDFVREWGIEPTKWVKVKSMAGCDGDKVTGLPGIGEKSAIKYLQSNLKGDKLKLIEVNEKYIKFTHSLVVLPHPKTQSVEIIPDNPDFRNFEKLCLEYGFRSFLKKGMYEKWVKILS